MKPSTYRDHQIDLHVERVKAEIAEMSKRAMTDIKNAVGFYNRSASQIRRHEKARKELTGK